MRQQLVALGLAVSVCWLPCQAPVMAAELSTPNVQITPAPTTIADPLNEDSARELIQVTYSPIPLASKLRKTFEGYQVQVFSEYPRPLKVYSATINNGQPGSTAFGMVESSLTPAFMTFLLGLAGFIVIGLPIIAVKSSRNSKAQKESLKFSNQVPLKELLQGETLSFTALVPFGQKPDLSLTFKDRQSGLLFNKHSN